MAQPVGFGILGAARIARKALVPAILQSPHARLIAVGSERQGIAKEWALEIAMEYPGIEAPRTYESYSALIEDPDIQAVYIPATGDRHHPLTLRAASAGKQVLCEKSLATSVAEAEEMVEACQKSGVLLQEAFMWRHHPRTRKVLELLTQGEIGDLRLICAHFSFDIDRSDWRLHPQKGGGAIWDIGCYGVNAARYFTQAEPDVVHGQAHWGPTGVDMTTQIALAFPDGVLANIDCSFESSYRNEVELRGSRGRIVLPKAFGPPPQAELHLHRGIRGTDELEIIRFEEASQYAEMIDNFCASIDHGKLLPPAENGLANMRVLEQALKVVQKKK